MSTNKFYITTPIYYVNDKPHIGHAYTTVAADILARWQKMNGKDVFFLTGTDEHGAKIAEAAEKAGQEPQVFCDQVSAQFQEVWQKLGIHPDFFIRTTNPEHQKEAVNFLLKLKEKDYLYEKDYSGLYCVGCEKFITEKELVRGKCPDHKSPPARIAEKNWFFKLKGFLPQIEKLIQDGELIIQPENARKEVLGLFKQELDDFSISRQKVKWGIKLPWDPNQTIYVWVDALLNYWTALDPLQLPLGKGESPKDFSPDRTSVSLESDDSSESEDLKDLYDKKGSFHRYARSSDTGLQKFWPPDLHLIGKDILKFHCIYWPAMLLAAGSELPHKIFVHGYFTVNGQKMSKTIGNVIDPNTLVEKYGADATRYLLLSQFPFGQDGDISEEKLKEVYNAELANGIGNLLRRVLKMVEKDFNGIIPTNKQENKEINCLSILALKSGKRVTTDLADFKDFISEWWVDYVKKIENLELFELLDWMSTFVSVLDMYIETHKPFQLVKINREKAAGVLYNLLESLRHLAWMLLPFMPETADKIFEQLGLDPKKERGKKFTEAIKWGGLKSGIEIKPGKSLFPRL